MGHSIFDWDDEEDKHDLEPPIEPVDPVDSAGANFLEVPEWADPWKEEVIENRAPVEPAESVYYEEPRDEPVEYVYYQPETVGEEARRGGLAWSAGIIFFSSVVFMLLLGWFADLLLGTSPWGIVGGIILGSIIGFIQFFRITSQIFNSKKAESAMRPLMPHDDDDR